MALKKCKFCGKNIKIKESNKKFYRELKYCSKHCVAVANSKIRIKNKIGFWNSKIRKLASANSNKTQKLKKIGIYGISKSKHIQIAKKSNITNKRNGTAVYDKRIQRMGGKIGGVISSRNNKRNGTAVYDKRIQLLGRLAAKKNKVGFYNPKNFGKGYDSFIKNKNLFFNGVYYGSKREAEMGLCFNEQIEKIDKRKNFQVLIERKFLDFVNHKDKSVIEVHPISKIFGIAETTKQYFNRRRKLLNNNGFKNYNLLVIS